MEKSAWRRKCTQRHTKRHKETHIVSHGVSTPAYASGGSRTERRRTHKQRMSREKHGVMMIQEALVQGQRKIELKRNADSESGNTAINVERKKQALAGRSLK